ncbi:MAG: thioredoxin family protein [Anaerofustis sp.]
MALFGKKKKEEQTDCGCGCTGNCTDQQKTAPTETSAQGNTVKILGSGCAKCNQLEAATKEALASLGMSTEVDHITDFAEIAKYGVMSTPALVIDGKVVSYGKVLKTDEVVKILKNLR